MSREGELAGGSVDSVVNESSVPLVSTSREQTEPLALVTGGSGYFGGLLVQCLLLRGYRVRVFDRMDACDRPRGVAFEQGDIRDAQAVRRACRGVSVVHHNVAQVPLAKDRSLFETVNVGGTKVLLESCLAEGVQKVVHVSSSAVFGVPKTNPVDEGQEPRPQEPYGDAKLRAERVVRAFVARGLDVTIVRPRTILGHGRLGIFQILFELVRRGRPIYVLGGGNNRYQFVHADDLADACIRAGEVVGPDVFNIGADRFGTMRSMLTSLVQHAAEHPRHRAPRPSPIRSLPMGPTTLMMGLTSAMGVSPLGPYHALMYGREMYFDVTKAKERLGFQPKHSNDEMICESYDDYLENRTEVLTREDASHHRSAVRGGILSLLFHLP